MIVLQKIHFVVYRLSFDGVGVRHPGIAALAASHELYFRDLAPASCIMGHAGMANPKTIKNRVCVPSGDRSIETKPAVWHFPGKQTHDPRSRLYRLTQDVSDHPKPLVCSSVSRSGRSEGTFDLLAAVPCFGVSAKVLLWLPRVERQTGEIQNLFLQG